MSKLSGTTAGRVCHTMVMMALLCAVASWGVACKAGDEIKQGGLLEFCDNRDDDCRAPYICVANQCVSSGTNSVAACTAVCDKLATCNTGETNCFNDCQATVEYWRADAIDTFGSCLSNDKTCGELGDAQGATARQACYNTITLDDLRKDTCYGFRDTANECGTGTEAIDEMTRKCLKFARTRPETNPTFPAQAWNSSSPCVQASQDGACGEFVSCLNTTYLPASSEPKIQLR